MVVHRFIVSALFHRRAENSASMSKIGGAIREISDWEREAEETLGRSDAEVRKVLEDARREARETMAATEKRCAAEREALLQAAADEGRREAEAIARETESELERMRTVASSRRAKAVDFVLREMRAVYGGH
ncbi:MAG: hypothetical protein ACE5IM_12460 [Nitrospinota bacterium]